MVNVSAETYLRECLTIREKKLPDPGAPGLFNTKSMLGAHWPGRRIPARRDAPRRRLFRDEGPRSETPPAAKPRLPEAIQRLVDLYAAWEKPEDAERWRKKLEESKSADSGPE